MPMSEKSAPRGGHFVGERGIGRFFGRSERRQIGREVAHAAIDVAVVALRLAKNPRHGGIVPQGFGIGNPMSNPRFIEPRADAVEGGGIDCQLGHWELLH